MTAGLSVAVLFLAIIWTLVEKNAPEPQKIAIETSSPPEESFADTLLEEALNATSTDSGLSPLGDVVLNKVIDAYSSLSDEGTYSESKAKQAAQDIAKKLEPVVQGRNYGPLDLKTTKDISLDRVLLYRSDLRESLAPLLSIPEPEYSTFARFVETRDPAHLLALERDANLYRIAASSTLRVEVPADAVPQHLAILNAMENFASTLEALATHATDPFASAALLRSYNQGEEDMLTSFNALAQYYRKKANAPASATTTSS
jgi:hypothetical protein